MAEDEMGYDDRIIPPEHRDHGHATGLDAEGHAPPMVSPFAAALQEWLVGSADLLDGPLVCKSPGRGVPGDEHCAACCYGTGLIITCVEDQALADAAKALRIAAHYIEHGDDDNGARLLRIAGRPRSA